MLDQEYKRSNALSEIFKALGHPSRLFIVEKLGQGEFCVCELSEMVGGDMSTVSRHLSVLKNAGVVQDRKEGTTVYYSLACDCLNAMISSAENIVKTKLFSQTGIV